MKRTTLAMVLFLVVCFASISGVAQSRRAEKPEKAKDPVCGLMVDKDPKLSSTYRGETYYFCSKTDLEEFRKNPEKYVKR